MKYNVRFKLDTRTDSKGVWIEKKMPINAKISFAGDRLNYFTGYRIDNNNFETDPTTKGMFAKKNTKAFEGKREVSYSDVNRRLNNIDAALRILFDPLKIAPERIEIIRALDEASKKTELQAEEEPEAEPLLFIPMFKTYIDNSSLSPERKKHAFSALNHWQRFADKKKIILTFDLINPDLLRAFEKFLLSEKKTVKIKEGENVIEKKVPARGKNTIHTTMAITRTYWNQARKELKGQGVIIPYPFESYSVPAEVYGDPIFISMEERNELFNMTISSERLAQVRDIFIFQCLTGARVADMTKWTKSHIQNNAISYIPRKTKDGTPVTVKVPLSAKAKEILSRYNLLDGRLLPFISGQKYNVYLKELFELAGLVRIVTRQHPTTREAENVRLCDIASSHMARRTFVGGLFGKVDSSIISAMSGHVEGSKAFARYHGISEELKKNAIDLID